MNQTHALTRVCATVTLLALFALTPGCSCDKRVYKPPKNPITDAAVLLRALKRPLAMNNMTAFPRVEYYSKSAVRKGTVAMVLQPPGHVRFEALAPSGNMVSILTSDGTTIALYERGRKRCYAGPACARNVSRLLPIVMEGRDLVKLLMGRVPLIAHSKRSMRFNTTNGMYELRLESPTNRLVQLIALDTRHLRPSRSEVRHRGKRHYLLEFKRYKTISKAVLPMRINFKMPRDRTDLAIKFREVTLDRKLKMKYFRFQCPRGVKVVQLRCAP